MDEPLSNLDAKLRGQMRTEIGKLHKRLQTTFIYVTHDQTEAMTMGTRIVVMKDGFIQQIDSPQVLYEKPCNVFVAGFIGSPPMNFIDAKLEKAADGGLQLTFGNTTIKLPEAKAKQLENSEYIGKTVLMGIRPENIHDEAIMAGMTPECVVSAHVDLTEMMGAETYLYVTIEGTPFVARVNPRTTAKIGDQITLIFEGNRIHLFDKETEMSILN